MDLHTEIQILLEIYVFLLRRIVCIILLYRAYLIHRGRARGGRDQTRRRWSIIYKMPDQLKHMRELVELNDQTCIDNLRMDRDAFWRLCYLLEHVGGLRDEKFVGVPEKVATFLSILAHHKKNRIVKHNFKRSGHTVSKYFKQCVRAVIKISLLLLVDPQPISDDCTTDPWRCFKGCLGALDGTYVLVRVRKSKQTRYRSRKGQTAVNVLRVCNRHMNFIYVLVGYEGSAADSRVLRSAVNKPHGLKVPVGNYYLCDAGYTNCEGFLTPYRGVRYHLDEWSDGAQAPQNARKFFNMKHARARNVIERAFGLLKGRWAVLRSTTYYPIRTQNMIIMACALLHNYIRTQMARDPLEETILGVTEVSDEEMDIEHIDAIESTPEWSNRRDDMATSMYDSWRAAQ